MGQGGAPRRARTAAAERLAVALSERGCPVCSCLEADARRDLAAFLREQVMDPAGRAALRAAGGFCGWHTGLLPRAADGILSVVILAEDLLATESPGRVRCPACATLGARAERYLDALLDLADAPAHRALLEAGPGVPCRPHLSRLRALGLEPRRVAAVERAIAPRLARLRADLQGFIAKQDYRSPAAPRDEEAQAWREALEHLAGRPTLFGSDLARLDG